MFLGTVFQAHCSSQIFPSPFVPGWFPSPYASQNSPQSLYVPFRAFRTQQCFTVHMFPKDAPVVTMFPTPYAIQSRCSPEVFSGPYVLQKYSPVSMFASPYIHSPDVLQTQSFLELFSFPMISRDISQSLCSSVPFILNSVLESLSSPKMLSLLKWPHSDIHLKCLPVYTLPKYVFQSLPISMFLWNFAQSL